MRSRKEVSLPHIDIKKTLRLQDSGIRESHLWLFSVLGLSVMLGAILALVYAEALFLGIPALLLLIYQTAVDFRKVFFLLLASIPVSMEYYFPGGLATDLPTEPLVAGLMLAYGLSLVARWKTMGRSFLMHPVTLFLLLHLAWMLLTTFTTSQILVSVKFLIAKTWYVAGYYFLAGSILKTEKDFRQLFWGIFTTLMLALLLTVYRHFTYDFGFEEIKKVMWPCWRNHVNYSAVLDTFFPFILAALAWYNWRDARKWILLLSVPFMLFAIYTSYTRAAYVALALIAGCYFVIRWRLMKIALVAAMIMIVGGLSYILEDNRYMDYAPDYATTISHENFDDLLSATSKGKDVSTMERVYRWVAALHMHREKPLVGFGPGNFHDFYKSYTVRAFETYVSDNPEKSGIHCYYLMVLVEQGLPGALIFLFFTFFVLAKGENIYHQCPTRERKRIVMALLLSLVVIDAFLIINDIVETDKSGSFFFMNIAMLVNMDLLNRRDRRNKTPRNTPELAEGEDNH